MPTPFGHALAGVAVAWTSDLVPPRARRPALAVTCAALAMVPDVDLVLPATHRAVTHSIGAVAAVIMIAAAVTGWVRVRSRNGRGLPGAWRVALVCGAAYASHILLDWLGVDRSPPLGIQALWPLKDGWYLSGLDLFAPTERRHLLSVATWLINMKAAGVEALVIGPVLAVVWSIRVKAAPRLATEVSGSHHPAQ